MEPQDHRRITLRAYRAFLAELTHSLSHARDDIERFENKHEPAIAKHLAIEFHKIKGGAGFFGLSDVANKAAALQETFLESKMQTIQDGLDHARSLLTELEQLSRKLPPAETDGEK